MSEGKQKVLRPFTSTDCWLQTCDVQKTINSLIFDLVSARPKNVMDFIHHWSAPPRSRENLISTRRTHSAEGAKYHGYMENRCHDEDMQGSSLEALLNYVAERDIPFDEDKGSLTNTENVRMSERGVEPSVELLRLLYCDARESPFEFLLDKKRWEEKLRCGRALSFSSNSIGLCIGRGNYGFVVPAQMKKKNKNRSFIIEEEKPFFLVNPFNGTNELSYSFATNNTTNASVANMLPATEECSTVVAIKVSPVTSLWSLDEANTLALMTARRQLLEREVQRLGEEFDALCCIDSCSLEQGHKQDEYCGDKRIKKEDKKKYLEGFLCEKLYKELLKARLKTQNALLKGAQLVTTLIGDVMYDTERDILLFPFTFYPFTLKGCVEERIKHCGGSIASARPFPNFVADDTCGTVMAALFSVQELRHVARSLCHALNFLNTLCGMCHLDVKLENILISAPWLSLGATQPAESACDEESFPRVVLGDFGLAQPLGSPIVQIGDYCTMAPEVYWARASGNTGYTAYRTPVFCASSDIWSVGCVLLQMINGLEYCAWGSKDMFVALEENHVSPAVRHPEVWPMELNDFVARCFERDPRRRMEACDALRHPFLASL